MLCTKSNNTQYTATWKIYYPDCRLRLLFCNAGAGAYVPAITVCLQTL